jgi:hypothetical protein
MGAMMAADRRRSRLEDLPDGRLTGDGAVCVRSYDGVGAKAM